MSIDNSPKYKDFLFKIENGNADTTVSLKITLNDQGLKINGAVLSIRELALLKEFLNQKI